jgi:GNAT superfamily N-acetyltransferase
MSSGSEIKVRPAERHDVPALVRLLEAYMREIFESPWHGTAEALGRDGFGREFETQVATSDAGEVVGFVIWMKSYDVHHCTKGGYVLDLFVSPEYRGRAVAPALILAVVAAIQERGGTYIMGRPIADPTVERMYDRVGVRVPGTYCVVQGRAFRQLARLVGRSPRVVSRYLPEKAWNDEP